MQIIKDQQIVDDSWQRIESVESISALPEGNVIVPFSFWLENKNALLELGDRISVCLNGDDNISQSAKDAIQTAGVQSYVSDASLWEISIKQSIGKIRVSEPFDSNLLAALNLNKIELLPISRVHLFYTAKLPFYLTDPFDRLLIATSVLERVPIVTPNENFSSYDCETIW